MIKTFESFVDEHYKTDIEKISDILLAFENFIDFEMSSDNFSIFCIGDFDEKYFTHNIEMGDTGRVEIGSTLTHLDRYTEYGYTGNNVTELVINRLIEFGYKPRLTSYTNTRFHISIRLRESTPSLHFNDNFLVAHK